MKLSIKKKYFDMIKRGEKDVEFRDAHITFVCEDTGESIRKEIEEVIMVKKDDVPKKYRYLFSDEDIMEFMFKSSKPSPDSSSKKDCSTCYRENCDYEKEKSMKEGKTKDCPDYQRSPS